MVVECPIGVVILVVPHAVEDTEGVRRRDNGAFGSWRLGTQGKLCLGGSAGENQRHRLRRARRTTDEVAQAAIDVDA
jgi:hypothetical protein